MVRFVGVVVIDVIICVDNVFGLGYYLKIGFVDYDWLIVVEFFDGCCIDCICKKFVFWLFRVLFG